MITITRKEGEPVLVEEDFDPSVSWDKDPIPENVSGSDLPAERVIKVPGLKSEEDFQNALNGEEVGEVVQHLNNNGKHVKARWKAGEVTLFVAKHPGAIIASSLGVAAGIAGAFYLIKSKKG